MATTLVLTEATGVQVLTDIDHSADIPVLSGLQRQGDVLIRPTTGSEIATTGVPVSGTPVVEGENNGNIHAIYAADGPVFCDVTAVSTTDLRVALLSVPEGSTAYLGHPEHGFLGIAPGSYELRRQREMADEIRMVSD